jgi:hypothetical protein
LLPRFKHWPFLAAPSLVARLGTGLVPTRSIA